MLLRNRKIAIVYYTGVDDAISEAMANVLADGGYDAHLYGISDENTIEQIYMEWAGSPDLVITVNLAGFSYRSSGDNSMYATLDVNTIHYIDRDVDGEEKLLSGLIPITMKFLCDDAERCRRIVGAYRRIHDISTVSDIKNDIAGIVDNLDWRRDI